jgi:hypothetical protein
MNYCYTPKYVHKRIINASSKHNVDWCIQEKKYYVSFLESSEIGKIDQMHDD